MAERPLVEWIVEAFGNLQNRAHLSKVYEEVRRLGYDRGGEDLDKIIRSEIQKHSQDSSRYTQNAKDDLFTHVGEERSGVWELREPFRRVDVESQDLTDDEIDRVVRSNRLQIGVVPTDSQQALVRLRRGQARIHQLTVANYAGRCAVCDVTEAGLLVASHIVGWAEAPEHRGDLSNVICLCRIHDALFEVGYWSLGDNLELLKKPVVTSDTIRQILDGMTAFRAPLQHYPARRFCKLHRERVGLACGFGYAIPR